MSLIKPIPAPQLPYELLDGIVRALPTITSQKPCTLVSRAWAAAAYPRVFRCIKLSEFVLMEDPPKRGRYCVKRLLDSLLASSSFLPLCVKELYLDTFDSDGFTFNHFQQVLSRFPGLDVIGYDVRHFVLSPPSPSGRDEQEQPRLSLPIATGRRFSKIHISIGEYGTASAFSQFIGLFDPDCIEELSIGHLELEEDRCPYSRTNERKARPKAVVKQTSGGLTNESMRILHSVLDIEAVQSIYDETDGGQFVSFLSNKWHPANVQHLFGWFSAKYPHEEFTPDKFRLSKFPNLRTLSLAMEVHVSSRRGLSAWEPFGTFVDILNIAPPTLHDVNVELAMVNTFEAPVEQHRTRPLSVHSSVTLLQDMGTLGWGALEKAMQRLSRSGCRPTVRIRAVMRDDPVGPEQHRRTQCSVQTLGIVPVPRTDTERHANKIMRDTVIPHLIRDSQVRENISFEVVLDPTVE
ncbi:hypothetical protein BDY19DRAFT_136101 [Irpex rosettiformis]|uniref:Uncharacterized protein n=1 Tax=Irpex rosettiformis TaxID=378272 RepID=A0ACB8U4Q1_9APHY|nr:hypothetical protein BDY19DRAFT_136101 [Irpex rosettiformis]